MFRQVHRVLADDGTLWLNLGDSYSTRPNGGIGSTSFSHAKYRSANSVRAKASPTKFGLQHKDLIGIPWRVAFALQADGWILRQDIIWHKPNPMPESVLDRCTKAHEYIFLLSKSPSYYYDADSIKEPVSGTANPRASKAAIQQIKDLRDRGLNTIDSNPESHGVNPKHRAQQFNTLATSKLKRSALLPVENRNKRSVWSVPSQPYSGAHFATFPPDLIKPCILAGSRPGDTILDPFGGSGTTGMVALELGRKAILCEVNPDYRPLIESRCAITPGLPL